MKKTFLSLLLAVPYLLGMPHLATAQKNSSAMLQQEKQQLTPELLLTMARVGDFSLSPDGKRVVYAVSFPDIKENKAKSKIFTVGSDGKDRREIGEGYAPKWLEKSGRIAL